MTAQDRQLARIAEIICEILPEAVCSFVGGNEEVRCNSSVDGVEVRFSLNELSFELIQSQARKLQRLTAERVAATAELKTAWKLSDKGTAS